MISRLTILEMMTLIDSHVHLNDEAFHHNVDEIITKSMNSGVEAFVCVGYDNSTNLKALAIAEQYPNVFCTVGFHPSHAQHVKPEDMTHLEEMLRHPKVVGIGECGLDYFWDQTYKAVQHDVFKAQIDLANKTGKPLVIHMRDSAHDVLEMLKKYKHQEISGVMHCYSGSSEMVRDFVNENLYISLAGPVTFKNAVTPKAVAKIIPSHRLLIETDAPYLAPHPYRGKENNPSFLPIILESIAFLRNMDIKDLDQITMENTRNLFHLPIRKTFIE
jgi:TatD DNase family protein